jgi:hypothetical protein|tara:strand:+ start:1368 stop:1601 length:234 start_codon:yes stop_codon:yes gene_type:complete
MYYLIMKIIVKVSIAYTSLYVIASAAPTPLSDGKASMGVELKACSTNLLSGAVDEPTYQARGAVPSFRGIVFNVFVL